MLMAGTTAEPILRERGYSGLVSKHHFVASVTLGFLPQEHERVLK